jgi:hypothetical protein
VPSELWYWATEITTLCEQSIDKVWDYWDALEESPLLMGEVLPLMTLATEIAAHSECIIYDALFLALAESEELHPASHLCLVV